MAASTSSSPPASLAPARAPAPAAAPGKNPLMGGCLSCRLLSGVGLLGAGGYVYWTARRPLKLGCAPSPGTIFQMVVGISIACWGVVILVDPVGKAHPIESKKQ
ncbi:distal membrane-arm assembly complex protein 1 [Vombatus ursinus]|uniref:Distal membrane-arm assembly complex protein 1-like domain-containing protein n=1 Tax=Vombatus ursinus TaxID=29139 RepID=A0A4X2KDI2_VOMUR|nr:distal membrane-arm assembly complex protein 1 [Vombatus ursinus]